MGCHFLLQGIFPTQGSSPCSLCLLNRQADSLPLSYLGTNTPHAVPLKRLSKAEKKKKGNLSFLPRIAFVLSCSVVSYSFVIPRTVIHQAPLSMGFCRPEYWSGLPFPPPGDLPDPGIKPRSLALQVDSLPSEPPGKTKNIGVGSLSLLQGIFPTQESSWGLLRCRWILYQLSYQGRLG